MKPAELKNKKKMLNMQKKSNFDIEEVSHILSQDPSHSLEFEEDEDFSVKHKFLSQENEISKKSKKESKESMYSQEDIHTLRSLSISDVILSSKSWKDSDNEGPIEDTLESSPQDDLQQINTKSKNRPFVNLLQEENESDYEVIEEEYSAEDEDVENEDILPQEILIDSEEEEEPCKLRRSKRLKKKRNYSENFVKVVDNMGTYRPRHRLTRAAKSNSSHYNIEYLI
jgi:hypothetical protein